MKRPSVSLATVLTASVSTFLIVTAARAMTPPDESCTTPEIVPVLTCENKGRENSATPRIAQSPLLAFRRGAIFQREFIALPFFKWEKESTLQHNPGKDPYKEWTDLSPIALRGEEVK